MSNLTPEKRTDKNGRIVTRHVKTSNQAVSGKPMPKPQITNEASGGLTGPPTRSQSREHFFMLPQLWAADNDVLKALGVTPHARTGFKASEYEVYDVLTATDRNTATALLEAGVTTHQGACTALRLMGRDDLIHDNTALIKGAMDRGIIAVHYLNSDPENPGEKHYLDYLESMAITPIRSDEVLHKGVRDGRIRLQDIREITPQRIAEVGDRNLIRQVLNKLADGSVNYTAKEVCDILDRNSSGAATSTTLRWSFDIADEYGAAIAIELPPTLPTITFFNHLVSHEFEVERGKSLLRYSHRIFSSLSGAGVDRNVSRLSKEDIIVFHDAGVNPDQVAKGTITINQVDGMKNHGIAPSVSGGWL